MIRYNSNYLKVYGLFLVLLFFIILIVSLPPTWVGSGVNYTFNEENNYLHNLTINISGYSNDVTFSFETDSNNISWQNASGTFNVTPSDLSSWITLNPTTGILNFNATYDNETGFFIFPIQAENTTDSEGSITLFEFIINATNDIPYFLTISENYNFSSNNQNPGFNISVFDEEDHHPFLFEINFTSCTHAEWLGIPDNTNCTLFNLTNFSATEAQLNYSGTSADVGVYNATINVTEASHSCPHPFCIASSYNALQSIQYNITVEVLSSMEINVSSCFRQEFVEGVPENCSISVRTRSSSDTFNLTSVADFSSYSGTPSNVSWFYPLNEHSATNNLFELNVTVNASKSLVGNWTINLSSYIIGSPTDSDFNWTLLPIFVNWTGNSNLTLFDFNTNYSSSIDFNFTIPFNVTDPDFVIEDKDFYDEDPIMNITVINLSSGLEVFGFFSINKSTANGQVMDVNVTFTPNSSHIGTYNVTINATDQSGYMEFDNFNFTVLSNDFPYWNATSYSYNFTVNSTQNTTVTNITSLNLSRSFANDSNVDDTLSFTNDSDAPPRFSLSSTGIIDFYPWKQDVGFWNFTITVSDQLGLTNSTRWLFNVSNNNSAPFIDPTISDFNGTAIDPSYDFTVNITEYTEITLHIFDNDLFISDSQITNNGAYNESFDINVTVTNTTFVPVSIDFEFLYDAELNNDSVHVANFTANASNLGNYTVFINVTDASNASDTLEFNISVVGVNNDPTIDTIIAPETSILDQNYNFTINASDDEDDAFNRLLNFTITPTNGGPALNIGLTNGSVTFNFSNDNSYRGNWTYNVTVNDSEGANITTVFNLLVNGYIDINLPSEGSVFNGTEGQNATFEVDVNDSIDGLNLTYYFYFDNLTYFNSSGQSGFNYSNITLRQIGNFTFNSSENLTFNYSFDFSDESYGLFKNATLIVFREGFETLNKSINYSINVTHNNDFLVSIQNFSNIEGFAGTPYTADLTEYFSDLDYSDVFYNQVVNYTLNQSDNTSVSIASSSSFSGWNMSITTSTPGTYNLSVVGQEFNSTDNSSISNVSSDWFTVTFNDPDTQSTSSSGGSSGGGGGGSSSNNNQLLEYFSIKIIAPGDITISPDNFIELNFSVLNNGNLDLFGINLSSIVELDGLVNRDLDIDLSDTTIETLAPGESQEFKMRIFANTEAVGEYRVVVFGNVTSPEFSDWGEFFVSVKSLDESQLAQLLVFTEKLISENPVCLELTETYNEAVTFFDDGNLAESERLLNDVIQACEDAISSNEQISFFDERVRVSFIYSLILSCLLFAGGIFYYFYRRIKFKKLVDKEYI